MNEQMGLAQQGQPMSGQGQQQQGMAMLEQVIIALQGGMSPDQLIQQGVPVEIVEAAMQQLQAMAAEQQQAQLATPAMQG